MKKDDKTLLFERMEYLNPDFKQPINEELEEGKLGRALGTAGMAAAMALSPMQKAQAQTASTQDTPQGIEQTVNAETKTPMMKNIKSVTKYDKGKYSQFVITPEIKQDYTRFHGQFNEEANKNFAIEMAIEEALKQQGLTRAQIPDGYLFAELIEPDKKPDLYWVDQGNNIASAVYEVFVGLPNPSQSTSQTLQKSPPAPKTQ